MSPIGFHTMFCRSCGYDLRASKDVCPECGTAFRADLPITFLSEPPASPRKDITRWFTIAFLVGAGMTLIVIFTAELLPEPWLRAMETWAGPIVFGVSFLLFVFVCAWRTARVVATLATAYGLTWGFSVTVSLVVGIQNGEFSVILFPFLITIFIVPFAMFALTIPLILFRRFRQRRRVMAVMSQQRSS